MNPPSYKLIVATAPRERDKDTAILGRDIRAKPEEIARHCWTEHRAISEDLATVAESVALADRMFPRHRGKQWARAIELEIPVFQIDVFERRSVAAALIDALHFLTGDLWTIQFVRRSGKPLTQGLLPFEQIRYRYVTPYSDGLDSFSQVKLLEAEGGPDTVLKLRSARMGQDSEELRKPVLRVPRGFGSKPKKEQSYRSRPFVFFTFAAIGAFVAKAEAIVIGETGQGALGPAIVRYAGEWPFRSTHPGFARRMERYVELALGQHIAVRLPQIWRTKGEVLSELLERNLLDRWTETRSCSARPNDKHGASACGICGGCALRVLATSSAGLTEPKLLRSFDPMKAAAVAPDGESMSKSERQMAARSFGTIVEFARLTQSARGSALIESESMLFDTNEPAATASHLQDLSLRHAREWEQLRGKLPTGGWAYEFAAQL